MRSINGSSLFRLKDAPFVLVKNARLTRDLNRLPAISADQINNARALAVREEYRTFANVPVFSVAIRDSMVLHYFHFMETFLTLYAVHRELFPNARLEQIYFGSVDWNNPNQNNVQQEILSLFYPATTIITEQMKETVEVENLLYIDRCLAYTLLNKILDPIVLLLLKWAPELRRDVYQMLAIKPLSNIEAGRSPKILYTTRPPPRTLSKEVEKEFLEILHTFGELEIINFATCSWQEQVRAAARNDIIVGVHGNNLTNLLWLPNHGLVIELFPKYVHQYDYQIMSEAMHLEYFGLGGDRIFRDLSRHGASYAYASDHITRLMVNEIHLVLASFIIRRKAKINA
jgi:Glycosyltransferase 61